MNANDLQLAQESLKQLSDKSPKELREIQSNLAQKVLVAGACIFEKPDHELDRLIAGVDVGHGANSHSLRACVTIFSSRTNKLLEYQVVEMPAWLSYIPGLLSFRELPPIIAALKKLSHHPDILMCDGQGIAHPRGLGIASHLGVLLKIPTIGIAKKKLVGTYSAVESARWANSELVYRDCCVGRVIRSRERVKPIFVSPGHLIDVDTASTWVEHMCSEFKLPEPTRWADKIASRRGNLQNLDLEIANNVGEFRSSLN